MRDYTITLSDADIAAGAYKELLGGGAEQWERRGRAQLDFLLERGLSRNSTLLDIGCGPLRAGAYLIGYLGAGNYAGFDYNESFIAAAEQVAQARGLTDKRPGLARVDEFRVEGLFKDFDFGLAFSVLNHCDQDLKLAFFRNIGAAFRPGASIFVTHAGWFDRSYLAESDLKLVGTIGPDDSPTLRSFGRGRRTWSSKFRFRRASLFPVLEFQRR